MTGADTARALAALIVSLIVSLMALMSSARADNIAIPHELSPEHPPGTRYMGIRLLGTVHLDAVDVADGRRVSGLSALGFDADAGLLYALSDRGSLFHLRPVIEDDVLQRVELMAAHPLTDARGRPLKGVLADAEGMVLRNARNGVIGDTEVVVSFERRPRVIVFRPDGSPHASVALPDRLRNRRSYDNPNRGLEAIADHPRHGLLVGPERPLRGADAPRVELFSLGSARRWWYPQPLEPSHALVALEVLPDGRLIALERAHGYLFIPFITLLREIPGLPDDAGPLATTRVLARFSTGQGFNLDNFEGLTRHLGQRFFMVSDDNGRAYQASLLSYFELTNGDGGHAGTAADGASRR